METHWPAKGFALQLVRRMSQVLGRWEICQQCSELVADVVETLHRVLGVGLIDEVSVSSGWQLVAMSGLSATCLSAAVWSVMAAKIASIPRHF